MFKNIFNIIIKIKNMNTIKLKPEFTGNNIFAKKIPAPNDFDALMNQINEHFKNNDPNKVYKITDKKSNKIIKDQNDFESLMLENFTEKEITLLINIIDKYKPPEYQEESNHIFFKSNLIIEEKKELTEEEKIKQNIREMVQSKMKILEKSIMEDISKKLNINSSNIHPGIFCSNCGMKNIIGIRYKCTMCPNFNLCENCEANTEHDDTHVLLKIKEPISSEKILEKKINDSIIIREQDFLVEPEEFKFKRSNLINIQTIYLTNNTNITWKKKTCFICVREKSSLIGNDVIFDDEVAPGNYTTAEIVYDNMENVNKKEYYSTYKLINENKEQIGKLHTFKILMS